MQCPPHTHTSFHNSGTISHDSTSHGLQTCCNQRIHTVVVSCHQPDDFQGYPQFFLLLSCHSPCLASTQFMFQSKPESKYTFCKTDSTKARSFLIRSSDYMQSEETFFFRNPFSKEEIELRVNQVCTARFSEVMSIRTTEIQLPSTSTPVGDFPMQTVPKQQCGLWRKSFQLYRHWKNWIIQSLRNLDQSNNFSFSSARARSLPPKALLTNVNDIKSNSNVMITFFSLLRKGG